MAKKLTLTDIKNEVKVYEEKKKVVLSDDAYVFIYPHFSPTKMNELIKEYISDPERAKEAGINFDEINMGDWYLFNIVYKFADLGIPSDIKKKVQAFTYLIDSKYFGKIIESFPQESLKALDEAFINFDSNLKLIMEQNGLTETENKIVQ